MIRKSTSRFRELRSMCIELFIPMILAVAVCSLSYLALESDWSLIPPADRGTAGVIALIFATSAAYLRVARSISRSVVIREHELYAGVLLYLAIAILIIVQCAGFGWAAYDLIAATASNGGRVTRDDALYFSAVTFTTLGYGDFVPRAGAGRMLASFEALLGTAHSVFFILVFLRGGNATAGATPAAADRTNKGD